ncbi:MAG: SIMPL domain-containing protein [Bacteroidales bacterium]|nr:SIMPL domain-containing protein [Bacteroidales bacterium]MBO5719046.1 SIMPL domain-containing protein [Bacteroidales bacterium]MBO5769601.1 SIMPL domain-containing protein [Bacteroidales bacterium]MBO5834674.1 SIMPL domain-containing protein [Bacteroidales bacterium]MBO5846325.1 SIMPL domain-containing protein [Bacteroidales bacterium]
MDKGKFYGGICIMLGLMFLGAMMPVAVKVMRSSNRTVYVKGLCEREVKADKVIWPITFKVMSNDNQQLYAEIARQQEEVLRFLQRNGIAGEEVSVANPAISDKFANEYGDNNRAYRYIATSVITVCSSQVDLVRSLMSRQSELLTKNVLIAENNWENPVEFTYEALNDIKPEMIEEATRNAREAAEKFAKDSGSKLGKISDASQGTFTISNRDQNTPYIKKVRVVTSVSYYLKN